MINPYKNKSVRGIYSSYKMSAKTRNLMFDLRFDEFVSLIFSACFYCGCSPATEKQSYNQESGMHDIFFWNGIDRIDNEGGYVPGNYVSCCAICNRMKRKMTIEDFFCRISRIYRTHIKEIKRPPAVTGSL